MMNQKRKVSRKRRDENEEQVDNQRLFLDELERQVTEDNSVMKRILKHPIAIGVMIAAGAYVALYASSYFMDAGGKMARSYHKFRHSLRPFPSR